MTNRPDEHRGVRILNQISKFFLQIRRCALRSLCPPQVEVAVSDTVKGTNSMYGMVHSGARSMVLDAYGEQVWQLVLCEAGLGDEHFISGQNYSDETTLSIIHAISKITGIEPPELLRSFGTYWIEFATRSHYGPMFRIAGSDLESFLRNLNRMHQSIRTTLPSSRMPTFEVLECGDERIDVLYQSGREGSRLSPRGCSSA